MKYRLPFSVFILCFAGEVTREKHPQDYSVLDDAHEAGRAELQRLTSKLLKGDYEIRDADRQIVDRLYRQRR